MKRFSFGNKDYTKELKTVECTSFLGQTSLFLPIRAHQSPQIYSKLQNGINDPKELENKLYTMMKGRETFYSDHIVPITSCSEVLFTISAFSVCFFFQNGCMLTLSDLDQR